MEHSKLGGSSTHRWMNCPGSVGVLKDFPYTTSVYAEEGTEAHEAAEYCLKKRIKNALDILFDYRELFPKHKHVLKDIQGMLENVQVYLDAVYEQLDEGSSLTVEQKFNLDWLYPGMFGTNDACVTHVGGTLFINDLKYGQGVQVEAEGNEQLMYYALGKLGPDNYFENDKVILTIVQPRGYHPEGPVRSWEISVNDLYDWGYNVLKPAAIATAQPNAPLHAGPWCKKSFCDAQATCPEMASVALEVAKADFATPISEIRMPEPQTLSPQQLIKMVQLMEILEPYGKELMGYIQGKMEAGDQSFCNYYKLVHKRTQRRWKEGAEADLGLMFGDIAYAKKMLSPAQLEKLVDKKMVAHMWEKPSPGVTIAPVSDKRKAVAPDFNAIPQDDFLN
jgi:hypothetical protein